MTIKVCQLILILIIATLFASCNDENKEAQIKKSDADNKEKFEVRNNEFPEIYRDSIIQNLQGNWREPQYPFRLVQFQNAMVKFTEEGVAEKPRFKPFQILPECPFEVNNIRKGDIKNVVLVMLEDKTCEIIKVSKDTLTLSGFSTNTNSNYNIVYARVN